MTTNFTPGPWIYIAPPMIYTPMIRAKGGAIAEIIPQGSISEANAHLIAAAPDMYEALKIARANLQFLPPEDVVEQIDAALAKAQGGAA